MKVIKVALNRPRSIGQFMTFASFIASRMKDNPFFPSPTVPIVKLLANIAALEKAQARMLVARNVTAARDALWGAVLANLTALVSYVQTVANQHGVDAEAIVASSGMSVKQSAGPKRPPFKVKQLRRTGCVSLEVRHPGRNAMFYFQLSTDGETWIDAAEELKATVTLSGLTPGVLYWFRYRVKTNKGLGDWSDPITLLVV
jgi:hypothetical protein